MPRHDCGVREVSLDVLRSDGCRVRLGHGQRVVGAAQLPDGTYEVLVESGGDPAVALASALAAVDGKELDSTVDRLLQSAGPDDTYGSLYLAALREVLGVD